MQTLQTLELQNNEVISFPQAMEKLSYNLMMKTGKEFNKEFQNLHKIAMNVYPQDFFNFLKEKGFAKEIHILQNNATEMLNAIDFYEIDMKTRTIKVQKGKAIIEEPLFDLSSFIKNKTNILPNSWEWNLLGSYFSDRNNFSLMQIALAVILKEIE